MACSVKTSLSYQRTPNKQFFPFSKSFFHKNASSAMLKKILVPEYPFLAFVSSCICLWLLLLYFIDFWYEHCKIENQFILKLLLCINRIINEWINKKYFSRGLSVLIFPQLLRQLLITGVYSIKSPHFDYIIVTVVL